MRISVSGWTKNRFLIVAGALAWVTAAGAQSVPPDEIHSQVSPWVPPPQITLRTGVRLVEIPIVVRDSEHRIVAGLTRDDFKIFDEGKRQQIASFSIESFAARAADTAKPSASGNSGQPESQTEFRYIALCFDDLHLAPAAFKPATDAALEFVKTSLSPDDRVAVITTSHTQDSTFTGELPVLTGEIEKLKALPSKAAPEVSHCPVIRPYEAYVIANQLDPGNQLLKDKLAECEACYHDPCHEGQIQGMAEEIWVRTRNDTTSTLAAVDSLVDGMARLPGRQRIILLTSSGFLAGEQEIKLDRLMDKARHAGVVINTLDARGLVFEGSGSMAYDGGAILASGTGGEYFHNNDLALGFRELATAPDAVYMAAINAPAAADGKFHKLKVQVAKSNQYSIQYRLGYTAVKEETPAAASAAMKVDDEVLASDTPAGFPISFNWQQWPGAPGMTMIVHLDISRMHFRAWNGRQTQKLTIVEALLDDHGNVVAGKKSVLQIAFREATFKRFAASGFTTAMTVHAPPGHYLARGAAQEAMDGKLSAASASVDIK